MKNQARTRHDAEQGVYERRLVGSDMWLEQGKWLVQMQVDRSESFQRRATQVAALDAVVLALLPTAAGSLRRLGDDAWHVTAQVLLIGCALLLLASAVSALAALRLQTGLAVPAEAMRQSWERWDNHNQMTPLAISRSFAYALFGHNGARSVVVNRMIEATERGKWTGRSLLLLTSALACLAIVLPIILLSGGTN
jgi:hypothetical protein